jgi:glycosyltransferase involved in cell wall biosynthesis
MIALGAEVLTGWGDTRERHLDYAARIGHLHMVVYSPRSRNLVKTALSDRLTVYPTRSATRPDFLWSAYRIGAGICRAGRIDAITTQDPFTTGLVGVWLKWRFGIPLDVQNHSDFFDNPYWIAESPLRYGPFNRLGKWVIRRADSHRVLNQIEKQKYVAMGIDPERVAVLSTPVRLGRFEPRGPAGEDHALRARLAIPPGAPMLLWVGKPGPVKRIPLLVEAFARVRSNHPDAHLLLVGDFSLEPEVIAQVERLGLREAVCFPGKVDHADLPAYYRLCSLYIHSSIYEGLGKVLIEAAASGRPVVSTRTAGAQEIVLDGQTGLLCALDDPADLAAKATSLLDNPERAMEMGMAGRAFVLDKFDHARNLDGVIETWRRTASLRGGQGCAS